MEDFGGLFGCFQFILLHEAWWLAVSLEASKRQPRMLILHSFLARYGGCYGSMGGVWAVMEVWEECGLAGFPMAPGVQTDLQKYVQCFEEDVASYGHRTITRRHVLYMSLGIGHVRWAQNMFDGLRPLRSGLSHHDCCSFKLARKFILTDNVC